MLIDVSSEPGLPRYSATKGGGLRCYPDLRDPAGVRLLVLHQWGTHATLKRRPGESREACAVRRARSVPYHLSVFEGGVVVWAWAPTIASWTSNGFNRASISIGVGGRFPELERRRTAAHSRLEAFEAGLVEALRAVAERLPGLVLVTHRQSSRSRRADPGEALARVAVRAAAGLGLAVDFGRTVGTGAPAPACWAGQI